MSLRRIQIQSIGSRNLNSLLRLNGPFVPVRQAASSSNPQPRTFSTTNFNSFSTTTLVFSKNVKSTPPIRPRRSMLYVPGSSDKMIKKSQRSDSDCIIFDLEDSVADHRKGAAREAVLHGLNAAPRPGPELAVRINPPSGNLQLAIDDLDIILPSLSLETIVMPKVEHEEDVNLVIQKAQQLRSPDSPHPLNLVLSIESASSLLRMPRIIEAASIMSENSKDENGRPAAVAAALLFASEDYCASTGIIRSRSRRELLFPRAQIVTIAKAYGLSAIDMVCIDYKDVDYMRDESEDGRALGFDGKQAIHPAQVEHIQRAYSPGEKEIERSSKIKQAYETAVTQNAGAVGFLDGENTIMIDAPMLKQAEAVLAKARAGGLDIPEMRVEQKK